MLNLIKRNCFWVAFSVVNFHPGFLLWSTCQWTQLTILYGSWLEKHKYGFKFHVGYNMLKIWHSEAIPTFQAKFQSLISHIRGIARNLSLLPRLAEGALEYMKVTYGTSAYWRTKTGGIRCKISSKKEGRSVWAPKKLGSFSLNSQKLVSFSVQKCHFKPKFANFTLQLP